MKSRKFVARNLPIVIVAIVLIGWFFLVGEAFSRYCPYLPVDQVSPLSCDVFAWWRWFD